MTDAEGSHGSRQHSTELATNNTGAVTAKTKIESDPIADVLNDYTWGKGFVNFITN